MTGSWRSGKLETGSSERLRRICRQLDVLLSPREEQQLLTYLGTLERWNRTISLTALAGENLVRRLVVEPLWVASQLRPSGRLLDVGSGNGSPALPWHVLRRFSSVALVESHRRKAVFLERVVREMGISDVAVHSKRLADLEDLEAADWHTLQGVRLTDEIYAQLNRFTASGTRLVWITGPGSPPFPFHQRLQIPGVDRAAFVFSR